MLLYGGIVKTKWAINSAFMAFYAFAMVLICWVLWAYKMAFGVYMLPFVGRPGPVVAMNIELQQSNLPSADLSQTFPMSTMIYFQFVFAAITLVILAGELVCLFGLLCLVIVFNLHFVRVDLKSAMLMR